MKILAISDIHGDTKLVKKVAKIADKEKVDLVIIAGDITDFNKKQNNLIKPFSKNRKVLLIHGNHETENTINKFSEFYKNVLNLHKKHHKENNIGFFGSGTTDWGYYQGYFQDAENIFSELEIGHKKIKKLKKKVMITHSPPAGSIIEEMGFPGSTGVRDAIEKFKPDFLICGHIHEGGGLVEKIGKTTVINVARSPTIFEI